uniref:Reverse transcriptase n=1 Tax=Tanacetum cinerariifolium TaxID=118510 RepID=A0A699IHS3_TANCI|nr:reverse transcriptase [Tanacetum cinerariifolium]
MMAQVFDAMSSLNLESYSVCSSTVNGILTLSIETKLKSCTASTAKMIRQALQRVIALATIIADKTIEALVNKSINDTNESVKGVCIRKVSIMAKIEFPKFFRYDPTGWVYISNQFFKVDAVEDGQKVKLASMHLYDKALAWHQQFSKMCREDLLWEAYVEALLKRFCNTYEDPMTDLKNISQKMGSVQVYIDAFDVLMAKAELMSTCTNLDSTNVNPCLSTLLQEHEEVFFVPNFLPPHRTHDHMIPLLENTTPINIRPYRLPPSQKVAIEAMVKELLKRGVLRASHIPFSSSIVMVKKKDGSWRMCVDYKALNNKTVKDQFLIHVIEELIDELCGAQVFTKLDFRSGYHQIRMFEDDIYKTAFRTHQEYLGHVIPGKRVATDPSKIKAMQEWPIPVNIKKLRGSLGLTGYYRRFVKNYAAISKPLIELLKKNSLEWSHLAQRAFDELKNAMVDTPVMALPNF